MEIKEQELRLTYKFLKEKHPEIMEELAKYVLVNLKEVKSTKSVVAQSGKSKKGCGELFDRDSFRFRCGEDYSDVPRRNFGIELCLKCKEDTKSAPKGCGRKFKPYKEYGLNSPLEINCGDDRFTLEARYCSKCKEDRKSEDGDEK